MICPYCGEEMRKGVVYGDRYKLKWIPEEKDKGFFTAIFSPFIKGIDLEKDREGIITFYCEEDEIFLIKSIK